MDFFPFKCGVRRLAEALVSGLATGGAHPLEHFTRVCGRASRIEQETNFPEYYVRRP